MSTRKSFADARWHSNSVVFTHTNHSDQLGPMGQPPQPVHTNGEIGVRTGLTDLTFVHEFILIRPLLRSRWTQTRSAAPPLAALAGSEPGPVVVGASVAEARVRLAYRTRLMFCDMFTFPAALCCIVCGVNKNAGYSVN